MIESHRVVNVAGKGNLRRELDLDAVQRALLEVSSVEETSKIPSCLTIKYKYINGKIMLYESGKYMIMGCESEKNLHKLNHVFLNNIEKLKIIRDSEGLPFGSVNFVIFINVGNRIDLNRLVVLLGEQAEYEPEQSSLLIYHPKDLDCTITISSSGKCVINTPIGEEILESVSDKLMDILSNNAL